MRQAAGSLGVTLHIHDIQSADDLPAAFEAGAKERAEGLIVTAESIFVVQRARVKLLRCLIEHRIQRMPKSACWHTSRKSRNIGLESAMRYFLLIYDAALMGGRTAIRNDNERDWKGGLGPGYCGCSGGGELP
jgi:hypothetical protein